jgi:hypothetical protein
MYNKKDNSLIIVSGDFLLLAHSSKMQVGEVGNSIEYFSKKVKISRIPVL